MTKEIESVQFDTHEDEIIELGVASVETRGQNQLADDDSPSLGGFPGINQLSDD
jgi:hypothetical protein